MISVSWYEAAQFCNWLSEKEGIPRDQWCFPSIEDIEKVKDNKMNMKLPPNYLLRKGYHLPTEAEWEFACRSGTTTAHSFGGGDDLLVWYAWYRKNAQNRTRPLGQKRPNDFGLFDMQGNTWEWCHDGVYNFELGPKGYGTDEKDNNDVSEVSNRCLRGASFVDDAEGLRAGFRTGAHPSIAHPAHSFRVARTLEPGKK